jgi:hypothetical protein|tara:strand:- start:1763 stop:2032 length:270 start_codon:yes stop_codon:yes gene_type:complete
MLLQGAGDIKLENRVARLTIGNIETFEGNKLISYVQNLESVGRNIRTSKNVAKSALAVTAFSSFYFLKIDIPHLYNIMDLAAKYIQSFY